MRQLREAGATLQPVTALQWLLAAVPYALGWLAALVWAVLAFIALAFLAGWRKFYGVT